MTRREAKGREEKKRGEEKRREKRRREEKIEEKPAPASGQAAASGTPGGGTSRLYDTTIPCDLLAIIRVRSGAGDCSTREAEKATIAAADATAAAA